MAFAIIAVTGNIERLAITRAQVERFGWVRNEPVLQWVCPVRSRKAGRSALSGKATRKTTYTYRNFDVDSSLLRENYSHLRTFFV